MGDGSGVEWRRRTFIPAVTQATLGSGTRTQGCPETRLSSSPVSVSQYRHAAQLPGKADKAPTTYKPTSTVIFPPPNECGGGAHGGERAW